MFTHSFVILTNPRGYINSKAKAVNIPFQLDKHTLDYNERFARMLRTLDHQVGMTNSIPNSVSFLELFKAREIGELDIVQRWHTNESAKSLAVPIGLKGKEDIVELNLHEKLTALMDYLQVRRGQGKVNFTNVHSFSSGEFPPP